jgi:beta-glucosidase
VELKSEGAAPGTSNRFVYTYTEDFEGWRFFNIPFASFANRTDYNPGPNPSAPLNLAAMWGYSILLPGGSSGTFYLDDVALTEKAPIADFEDGIPAGFVGFADSWDGSGSSTTLAYGLADVDLPVVPMTGTNSVVSVTYSIAITGAWWCCPGEPGYGGVTHDFAATQDWSDYDSFGFWYHGSNSGADNRVELKSEGADPGTSNRFVYTYTEDFEGWRFFNIPFASFANRTDYNPGPNPSAPLNLAAMWGYSILLPGGSSGTFNLDDVALYGRPVTVLRVAFSDTD